MKFFEYTQEQPCKFLASVNIHDGHYDWCGNAARFSTLIPQWLKIWKNSDIILVQNNHFSIRVKFILPLHTTSTIFYPKIVTFIEFWNPLWQYGEATRVVTHYIFNTSTKASYAFCGMSNEIPSVYLSTLHLQESTVPPDQTIFKLSSILTYSILTKC